MQSNVTASGRFSPANPAAIFALRSRSSQASLGWAIQRPLLSASWPKAEPVISTWWPTRRARRPHLTLQVRQDRSRSRGGPPLSCESANCRP
eukprot:scaffold39856_cov64-Phaeocystis_antarctica.AAC.4